MLTAHWPEAACGGEVLRLERDDQKSVCADGQEASLATGDGRQVCLRRICKQLDGDGDMLTAMARELVQNRGIGESADLLWKLVENPPPR